MLCLHTNIYIYIYDTHEVRGCGAGRGRCGRYTEGSEAGHRVCKIQGSVRKLTGAPSGPLWDGRLCNPWAIMGWALMDPIGPLWAGPLWPPWALMGLGPTIAPNWLQT